MERPDTLCDALILNVGADAARRTATTRVLLRAGCEVVEAESGEEAARLALEAPDRASVGLVVLDADLPDLESSGVTERLRTAPGAAAAPILYLSAEAADDAAWASGLEAGADAYLTEPVAPTVLRATVRALLRMRRARREAEERAHELARANEKLTTLLRALPVGVTLAQDPECRVVIGNAVAAEMYGARSRDLSVSAPSEERPRTRYLRGGRPVSPSEMPLEQAVRGDQAVEGVVLDVYHDDGEHHTLRVNAAPLHDEAGRVTGGVAVSVDITDLRRLRLQLEQEQALLESVLEQMPAGVVIVEAPSGRVVRVNRQAEEMSGRAVTASALAGRYVGLRAFRSDGTEYAPKEWPSVRALRTGKPTSVEEMLLQRPDSTRLTILASASPIHSAEGGVVGSVLVFHDISERKEAERMRAELAETLQAEISHRTKNNLAMVASILQLQATGAEPHVATALMDAATRLLTFASVHEQLQTTQTGEVDLLAATRRIAEATGALFSGEGMHITVRGREVLLPAREATDLAVVVNELITNAAKHGGPGPDGRRHVHVRVDRHEGKVRLQVWNSGTPLPASFDPARAAHMGLRLVRGLVEEQHHGDLHFRPEGPGTCVEVRVAMG